MEKRLRRVATDSDRVVTRLRAGAVVLLVVLAACSEGDDDAGRPVASLSGETATVNSSEALTPATDAA